MSRVIEVGSGFRSFRAPFKLFGMFDLGGHMGLCRLNSGKFVVFDTCQIGKIEKATFDELTSKGSLLEAVVATHPFHTSSFEQFYKWYPNAEYYGTPRHLKRIKSIPWAGSVTDEAVRSRWEGDGIFMRIPAGTEFENPAESNHFSGMFVYHQPSRSLFNDDTLLMYSHPNFILRALGKEHQSLDFWFLRPGLQATKEAPAEFAAFMQGVIQDWDFDNLCLAHTDDMLGGGKKAVTELLERERPHLQKIAASRK